MLGVIDPEMMVLVTGRTNLDAFTKSVREKLLRLVQFELKEYVWMRKVCFSLILCYTRFCNVMDLKNRKTILFFR